MKPSLWIAVALLAGLLNACAVQPPKPEEPPRAAVPEENAIRTALSFYAANQKGGVQPAPLRPQTPLQQLQLAMQLGNSSSADLARAITLLDGVLRADSPQAQQLQALARLLHDQYLARQRADAAADRAGSSARDAQRRAEVLQEKLDALAEIERSLPTRPVRPGPRKETVR